MNQQNQSSSSLITHPPKKKSHVAVKYCSMINHKVWLHSSLKKNSSKGVHVQLSPLFLPLISSICVIRQLGDALPIIIIPYLPLDHER